MRGARPRILGLSLLAAVGVMAVSASAAQGKWLLLSNKTSVLKQTFNFTANAMEFLVPALGLRISCEGGAGGDSTTLNASHTVQTGAMSVKLTGCQDLNFNEICTIHGVGDPNGTVSASATGIASMEGEKVLITAESEAFATIEYLGAECPLTEINGSIGGTLVFEVGNPLTDAGSHEIRLVEQNLGCESSEGIFHAGDPEEEAPSGFIETQGGGTTAMHLVAL